MGRQEQAVRWGLVGVLLLLLSAAEPPKEKPPWQRLLQGDDARKAEELEKRLGPLHQAAKFAEALPVAEALAQLREKAQGKDHWEAVSARWDAEALRRVLRQGKEAHDDYASLFALQGRAGELLAKGHYREAQPLLEKALTICRRVLAEDHPDTAAAINNLAFIQNKQGQYAEAETGYRKALAIRRRALSEDHPDTAESCINVAANLAARGQYPAAGEYYRQALAICRKVLGSEHSDTARACNGVAVNLDDQGKHADAETMHRQALAIRIKVLGEDHPDTAAGRNDLAWNLDAQGKYAEAETNYRQALGTCRKSHGEEHPDTALAYQNLADNMNKQGRFADAGELARKSLLIRRKVLGEDHPDTALSHNTVAFNLQSQGRYAEAEAGFRKALAIRRKVLGEEHPSTATSCNNVAANLTGQGKYAEAAPGYRKALDIWRKVYGEDHPRTAVGYLNVAANLKDQGRYAEAEAGFRKALAIWRKVHGEEHPATADGHNFIALNLQAEGKHAAAEEELRKALAIRRKVLGEQHTNVAQSCNNLAVSLNAQGKYAAGEEELRKALDVCRQALGEERPLTANVRTNLAANLQAQGKLVAAEEDFRNALAIRRHVLGEEHPDTVRAYGNLATNLGAQGRYAAAEPLWVQAADRFAKARLRIAAAGLGRAMIASESCPLPSLAAVLARNGKPEEAWRRFEESQARGTWDDLSARLRRPVTEQTKESELTARLERLEQALGLGKDTAKARQLREELLTQRRQAQDELDAFTARLEKEYGPAAGQVFSCDKIQAVLPADVALIGWLDLASSGPKAADPSGEHWAVLLRHSGPPVFERLEGSGPGGAWTEEDGALPDQLRHAVQKPSGPWQRLAQRLSEQRLMPLAVYLKAHDGLPAVRHLVVLPSPELAGVPVELLAEKYTVSYAHSGTLFVHLHTLPKVKTEGLLALADPVFKAATVSEEKPLPFGGVLLTHVQPGSNAAQSRLRPGDVLLRYNDKDLKGIADLAPLITAATAGKPVPVSFWRDGETFHREVASGKLGVVLADKPAPEAIAEQRRLDHRLASRGDDGWAELPGTRAEVDALRRLFPAAPAPLLLRDSDASEQKLYELAQAGELKKYRYVHLATHGEVDDRLPLGSAIILSRDNLPDPGKQLLAGEPVFDGRLTAEKVLRQWHLDCELVTLSACRTALGKYERGEGFVGFAQALVLCGSRSVCLSLWTVDDVATALVMQRFYANLLGRRVGLKSPLPKAEALAEAKQWLRTLPRAAALTHAATAYKGIDRGKRPALPHLPGVPEPSAAVKDDCPYAHPYYWAAFVLIGDPD